MRTLNQPNNLMNINLANFKPSFWFNMKKKWHKFSQNKLSIVGFVLVFAMLISAIFAPLIVPYPEHFDNFDFANAKKQPSLQHLCGTDTMGRDIFSRIIFAYRSALLMAIIVLSISVPVGVIMGLIAGFARNTLLDTIIMRFTDIFLSIHPTMLALAIAAVLKPNLANAMLAITISWWPWFCRLVYSMASSIKNEYFVIAAELTGASKFHILFREILPNCLSPIFTKMALDVGWVILTGASLSFVGLGEQPPIPALGQMVSDGIAFMPDLWWMSIFPSIAIVIAILGFNLLGDGVRDLLEVGRG